jgi:hypothetical protein
MPQSWHEYRRSAVREHDILATTVARASCRQWPWIFEVCRGRGCTSTFMLRSVTRLVPTGVRTEVAFDAPVGTARLGIDTCRHVMSSSGGRMA